MNFSNKYPKTKGVTLIEFLVAVAVIGLLMSIILTSITTIQEKARDARIIATTSQLRNIAEALNKDYNSYQELCCTIAACDIGTLNEGAPAPYGDQLGIIENDIKIRQGGALALNCEASINSYCLDVNLITSGVGRYCIDDDGHAMNTVESFNCATATTTCQ